MLGTFPSVVDGSAYFTYTGFCVHVWALLAEDGGGRNEWLSALNLNREQLQDISHSQEGEDERCGRIGPAPAAGQSQPTHQRSECDGKGPQHERLPTTLVYLHSFGHHFCFAATYLVMRTALHYTETTGCGRKCSRLRLQLAHGG